MLQLKEEVEKREKKLKTKTKPTESWKRVMTAKKQKKNCSNSKKKRWP